MELKGDRNLTATRYFVFAQGLAFVVGSAMTVKPLQQGDIFFLAVTSKVELVGGIGLLLAGMRRTNCLVNKSVQATLKLESWKTISGARG